MSLDVQRLERVRELAGGGIQARCPACAELGHDRKGEHLRIQPDGRFGCCVHPKDREHRKRIFALVGNTERKPFIVRVAATAVKVASASVKASLQTYLGTLGTLSTNPRAYARESNSIEELKDFDSRVPNVPADGHDLDCECLHTATPVPAVPQVEQPKQRMPHLLADGTLVIPFDSPERYHWWRGGQPIAQTRTEILSARKENDVAPF